MLNEVKHPFSEPYEWILLYETLVQSLRSLRMTFAFFWENLNLIA